MNQIALVVGYSGIVGSNLDLGRPIEVMTDMSKSRKLGFHVYQKTDESFFDLFEQLRQDRLIP